MLIVYNREGLHHAGNLRLMPGLNDVNEAEFLELAKLPAFKALIDEGLIELVSKEGKAVTDLSKMPTRDVVELVKATVDAAILKKMLETEKRQPVVDAIQAQLEAIDPTKKV